MSIPVSHTNSKPASPPGLEHANKDHAKVKDGNGSNKVKDTESPASAVAKSRASLNSAIVQTSLNVAISSGNNPLALLYRSAIEGINEALAPELGKDAIQNAAANQDNSAEATAERIVNLSTAFYAKYLEKNKLEDNEESRGKFIDVISAGFEKGFKEAQDILGGLKVLSGDVAAGIDKTHELVLKGFADFKAGTTATTGPQPDPAPAQP
jgi:hypothetical protein